MPFILTDDINVFYRVFLNSDEAERVDPSLPTMIVVHGGMGIIDHQLEVETWKPFSNDLQLIFIDTRGCGRTADGDPARWTMNQFGDDIFNFSNALSIAHPIVAGVSSGGYAVIAYATRHPEHPTALVLLNTEATVSPEAKHDAYASLGRREDRHEFPPFKTLLSDADIEAYADKAASASLNYDLDPSVENFEEFARWGFSLISKTTYTFAEPHRRNMEMKKLFANGYQKFNYLDDMSKIACPVLWLAGEWDPLHPARCAEEGAKNLARAELHVVPAGAPIYQDNPDYFYQTVRSFFVAHRLTQELVIK